MAVITTRKSDMSGEALPADVEIPTQVFVDSPYDNISFELDITQEEFAKLVKALLPFAKVGGDVHHLNSARKPHRDTESDAPAIRKWAAEMLEKTSDPLYKVNERGAIPNKVKEAYDARNVTNHDANIENENKGGE